MAIDQRHAKPTNNRLSHLDRATFLRLSAPTPDTLRIHRELSAYLQHAVAHCPPLAAALRERLMRWTSYQATADCGAAVFGAVVEAAEEARIRRRTLGPLACAAVAVFGPAGKDEADALLNVPHWLAANMYAEVGLMVGAFPIGRPRLDRHGSALAAPPVSFIAIGPTVPALDTALLSFSEPDLYRIPARVDDGRDVMLPHLGERANAHAARTG